MSEAQKTQIDDLVAQDTGARNLAGYTGYFVAGIAFLWALFQVWIASPLPFMVGNYIPVLDDTKTRSIHLAFAIFLAFMAFPMFSSSPRSRVPLYDWALALIGAFCGGYLFLFYNEIASRPGQPTTFDVVVSFVGVLVLLEAARRSLGPALTIVAAVFLAYVFFGSSPLFPDILRWKGASLERAASHFWLTTEGVYGIALGVSTSFVFLFVLFGSMLDRAGAGNYFIQLAFSLLGHLRGGPAKAAVIGSAMTGVISGSSIANVVTTGTFTIPLMKRVGYRADQAGAVEVSSSVNGQIMPPVMGAAAFLMVEYVGISYLEVIKHAVLPAVISYIALLYIVHLEALKQNMQSLPKPGIRKTGIHAALGFLTGFLATALVIAVIYFGITGIKMLGVGLTTPVMLLTIAGTYIGLVYLSARNPDLKVDNIKEDIASLPEFRPTFLSGTYYILPIVALVWFLMIERNSPGLSAFWALMLLIVIMLTQHPLKAFFRGETALGSRFLQGGADLLEGAIAGSRNMISIGVATAAAGIIVGTVTLTGVGQVMAAFVEILSGGNFFLMLVFVGLISLILGMGLPTTANYIVVSSLMAGVVVELGTQSGYVVPLIAVHLFVFYFGIMADVTPPVGLASFAAAAISGAPPIKTGVTAFYFSLRTIALPFLFIYNTDLLLINVDFAHGVLVFVISTIAMLLFAAATQGYFLTRSRLWESALLLLIAFTLFRPGFFLDRIEPPYEQLEPTQIMEKVASLPDDASVRVTFEGENFFSGQIEQRTLLLPLGPSDLAPEQRLSQFAGVELREEEGRMIVDNALFGGYAQQKGVDLDWELLIVERPADRMPKEVFWIPAFLLLGIVVFLQRRRSPAQTVTAPTEA